MNLFSNTRFLCDCTLYRALFRDLNATQLQRAFLFLNSLFLHSFSGTYSTRLSPQSNPTRCNLLPNATWGRFALWGASSRPMWQDSGVSPSREVSFTSVYKQFIFITAITLNVLSKNVIFPTRLVEGRWIFHIK